MFDIRDVAVIRLPSLSKEQQLQPERLSYSISEGMISANLLVSPKRGCIILKFHLAVGSDAADAGMLRELRAHADLSNRLGSVREIIADLHAALGDLREAARIECRQPRVAESALVVRYVIKNIAEGYHEHVYQRVQETIEGHPLVDNWSGLRISPHSRTETPAVNDDVAPHTIPITNAIDSRVRLLLRFEEPRRSSAAGTSLDTLDAGSPVEDRVPVPDPGYDLSAELSRARYAIPDVISLRASRSWADELLAATLTCAGAPRRLFTAGLARLRNMAKFAPSDNGDQGPPILSFQATKLDP